MRFVGARTDGVIARQMRSDMLEVIRQDYITTARAKGLPESKVIYRHGLKNAMIPVLMVIGGVFGVSLGALLLQRLYFSFPGLGSIRLQALETVTIRLFRAASYLFNNVCSRDSLVDVIFAVIDPRIRSQYVRRRKERRKAGNAVKRKRKKSRIIDIWVQLKKNKLAVSSYRAYPAFLIAIFGRYITPLHMTRLTRQTHSPVPPSKLLGTDRWAATC